MPLLIGYSIGTGELEEERAQDCGGYHEEYTGTEPRGGGFRCVGIAGAELSIDLDTADKTHHRADGIDQLRRGVEIGGHHRGSLVDTRQTVAGSVEIGSLKRLLKGFKHQCNIIPLTYSLFEN